MGMDRQIFRIETGDLYQKGIEKLFEHWEQVVTKKEEYIID